MSGDVAISCEGLSKTYVVRTHGLRGLVGGFLNLRLGNERLVEALKSVSFEVRRGEVFGLIGSNGAGKSTLLSCIAGVTAYDSGSLTINGQVDAVLKVGVGFHPALTGRENVIIGGISMGLPAHEAMACVDQVIAFAEVEKFADLPFYTYSSGMQARLQFAVSVQRTPDIMIIDEALATGDARFMRKSLRRIEEICAGGSTVLLVTHSIGILESLCHRALWLEAGEVVDIGSPRTIGPRYLERGAQRDAANLASELRQRSGDTGSGEIIIDRVTVNGAEEGEAVWNQPLEICVDAHTTRPIENPAYRLLFCNARDGALIAAFWNWHADAAGELRHTDLGVLDGECRLRFRIPHCPFGRNSYSFSLTLAPGDGMASGGTEPLPYVHRSHAGFFQVRSFPQAPWDAGRAALVEPCVDITVEAFSAALAEAVAS